MNSIDNDIEKISQDEFNGNNSYESIGDDLEKVVLDSARRRSRCRCCNIYF